ncbi:MAG: radical SAM protein [candidate division WOR-3 bacterium]|nr:MAG: radical SAM protein [candidate division WOR-3 bacterium]
MAYTFVRDAKDLRGLKNVMGVDFSPKKTCTYDCIDCGLGRTNTLTTERSEFYPAEEVFNEIRSYIREKGAPQHILLTGSGEPTLYAGFGKLATMIKNEFQDLKVMVYSNFSLLSREEVRQEVALCDIVWGSFNTVIDDQFKKVYRPHESIKLQDVREGLKKFRAEYHGILEPDTRFFKGINDSEKNVDGLKKFMKDVNPQKYYIFDPKHKGEPLAEDFIEMIKKKFIDLPFKIEYNV